MELNLKNEIRLGYEKCVQNTVLLIAWERYLQLHIDH